MMKILLKFSNKIEEILSVVLFVILILLGVAQVLFRFVFDFSLAWTEELSRFTFIFLVYIAASLAIMNDRHIRVQAIDLLIPKKMKPYLKSFADIIWLIVSVNVAINGYVIAAEAYRIEETSPALLLPMGMIYLIIPVTFFLMSFRIVQQIIKRHLKEHGGIL